jgi:hypothetical protein
MGRKHKGSHNRRIRAVIAKEEAPGVTMQKQPKVEAQQRRPEISTDSRASAKARTASSSPLCPSRIASPSSVQAEEEQGHEQRQEGGYQQSTLPPPRFFATDDHHSTSSRSTDECKPVHIHHSTMAYPPPPPEIDPAAAGGYGAYATNGTTGE